MWWRSSVLWEVVDMLPTRKQWYAALESRHGKELQKHFCEATVAVCGLGGLGSHIAATLARAGIGKLILIDFDRVDLSNLHRQYYKPTQIGQPKTEALRDNLYEINPYLTTEIHTARLTEANAIPLLSKAHILCEAFDDPAAKAMLTNLVLEYFPEKYLIAASGMAGLYDANEIRTQRITDHFYLCGDRVSDVSEGRGLVASRVQLCAAHQAHAVLQILADQP